MPQSTIGNRLAWAAAVLAVFAAAALLLSTSDPAMAQGERKISQVKDRNLPEPIPGARGAVSHTMYMDRGPEKVRAAKIMTQLHAEMAARGYTFADMEPYIENGDLEGWWLTYTSLN